MGAMRNLTIQFALIPVQVAMTKATEPRKGFDFKRLHKGCLGETGQKIFCKKCGQTDLHQNNDCSKGYATAGGYIEVDQAELDAIKVDSNGAIQIEEVTLIEELYRSPLVFTGDSYYLTPKDKAPQAYAAMFENLKGKVAIGRTAMYGREYTVGIICGDYGFIMHLLRYPSELRSEPILNLPAVPPNQAGIAKQVLDAFTVPTMNLDFPDNYSMGVQKMLDDKAAGIVPVPQPQAPPVQRVDNLEEQMRKSLEILQAKAKAKLEQKVVAAAAPPAEEPKAKAKGKKGKRTAA